MSDKPPSNTEIIHSNYHAPDGFAAFPVPIHHASTVLFKDVASMRARRWQDKSAYTYGLHGTPTSFTLEARLAELEHGKHCLLAPSGLAAITLVNMAMLQSGDEVLVPDNAYGPNKDLCEWMARSFGINVHFYPPLIGSGIADLIQDHTKLIWTEAPGSVTMEVPDIPAICAVARARNVLVAIDNTWSGGIAFPAFSHGVDVIMQALTKYPSGGSDVLMGAVITQDDALNTRLQAAHMRLGFGVGMDDAYLVLRSLATLKMRFATHDASARRVAAWLKTRPEIDQVLHPALPDCPGHETWKRDFTGAGGLFSVVFKPRYSEMQTDQFVEALTLFKIGFSWGGAHSLCMPYRVKQMRSDWRHEGILVRFNIGLEEAEDLIADIEQAFSALEL